MKLANLKLGVRLGIAFTVIIALMIAIISIAVVMLAKLNVASVQGCCVEECPP